MRRSSFSVVLAVLLPRFSVLFLNPSKMVGRETWHLPFSADRRQLDSFWAHFLVAFSQIQLVGHGPSTLLQLPAAVLSLYLSGHSHGWNRRDLAYDLTLSMESIGSELLLKTFLLVYFHMHSCKHAAYCLKMTTN